MAAEASELLVDHDNGTWRITLNRPEKMNALSASLVDALIDTVTHAHQQQAKLLVFQGAGKTFSAGFDLSDLDTHSEGDLVLRFIRIELLLQMIADSPAHTLCLAHGRVFGAAADLFAVCRQRVAAPDASFRMPGLKFGLVLGSRRFADIVGTDKARALLEETKPFSAQEAVGMGFVHQLAASTDWPDIGRAALHRAEHLDGTARADLHQALQSAHTDHALAQLVRSAARPGLKTRLHTYLQASKKTEK
jgi:enoyl-CoA hydratase